ncbi:MAG: HAMP domain-containing histidine kinase [Candidatus Marinimicrobia bacterium]|nr:HAMP domain-containing histidine kinase [Candidatus Neomarinimicrobiota bacterium]
MGAKIAHEINNPLTVILGQAQVQLTGELDPAVAESLNMIVEKATEVANLTRNYMNLGKPIDAKMEKINFGRVIHNRVKSLNGLGQLKNISISESYTDQDMEIVDDKQNIPVNLLP